MHLPDGLSKVNQTFDKVIVKAMLQNQGCEKIRNEEYELKNWPKKN